MLGPDDDMPWWWIASVVAAVLVSALVPFALSQFAFQDGKRKTHEPEASKAAGKKPPAANAGAGGDEDDDAHTTLEEEPWCPKIEIKTWQQASQLPACPWNFDDCESVPDALDRIWRKPLCKDLQTAYDALAPRVKNLQVAKVKVAYPRATHFAVIYVLNTGAELFGGAPVEHAVGLELGGGGDDADEDARPQGLRRRRGLSETVRKTPSEAFDIRLPCLLPFYRIHDGFGVLLTTHHLPVLLANPTDSVNGSCFYVYPARGLEPPGLQPHILKFARVDKVCVACADRRLASPSVIYIEKNGQQVEDDEHPLSFLADTVSNIAGQRVVPPMYMGGPAPYPSP